MADKTAEETELLSKLPKDLVELYDRVRDRATGFGEVSTGGSLGAKYLKFTAGRMFAEIHPKPRTNELQIYVRPEGYTATEGESEMVGGLVVTRILDKYGWALNHWFTVGGNTDLDAATALLRKSFDAATGPKASKGPSTIKDKPETKASAKTKDKPTDEDDGLYECGVCHEIFDDAEKAREHVDAHGVEALA